MMKKISLICLVSLTSMALTLEQSVDLALKNSTKLGEIQLNKDIQKYNKEQKQSLKYGELSLVGSFDHYNLPRTLVPLTPTSITPDIATTQDLFSVGINYSVALFTGFAQTRSVEIQELQENSAQLLENLTKEQIIYNVKSIYLSLLSLQKQLLSLEEYMGAQKDLLSIIHTEVELGKKAYIDELKATNDLEATRANKQKLLSNIDILKASMKYFINTEVDPLQDIDIDVKGLAFDYSNLNSLEKLQILNLSLQSIDKKIAIAKSSYYPQVSLSGYYGQNFGYNDSSNPNEGDFNNENIWQVGVKIKYNLYDFGSRSASVESAKLQKMQSKIKIYDKMREVQKDIDSAIAKFQESIANYKSATSQYKLLKESASIEKVRYDNGAATINDLLFINAQRELAKSKMIDAKYNYQKTIYSIEYLLEKGNK